jgi:hypothetical protein
VEIVDEIPKTVTGKVLRRQLRDQATASTPASESSASEPSTSEPSTSEPSTSSPAG